MATDVKFEVSEKMIKLPNVGILCGELKRHTFNLYKEKNTGAKIIKLN